MAGYANLRHVVVTPSRDESVFLPQLVDSMVKQSITPSEWIIVSHNSDKSSSDYFEEICEKHDWITIRSIEDTSQRKRGEQIAKLVNQGLSSSTIDWDFFSKIDADMVLPEDYFEKIFTNFDASPQLGIASGSCYLIEGRRKIVEFVSPDHSRGGLKTYRRKCFEEIGGIREKNGWDGIDNALAQMNGWKTCCFSNIEVHHQRRTGSYYGLLRGCFETGKFAHSMSYYPPFILARSAHRMLRKPIVIGGISMLAGYLANSLTSKSTFDEVEVIEFLRNKQKNRLKFWK